MHPSSDPTALYGDPPRDLVDAAPGAVQLSPLVPGAEALDAVPDASLAAIVIHAPPGTLERRFVLAHALRALRPGGTLTVLAGRDRGGGRLRAELGAFGCHVAERSKAHQRICETLRPDRPVGLQAAIDAGAPRFDAALGLWTQPGIFSFDRIDPGSALLAEALPKLSGEGADLGAGLGFLSRAVLSGTAVRRLDAVEIDRRAVEAARRNLDDPRLQLHWADARQMRLADLDFVVTNPPFHAGGAESRTLGQDFIRAGAAMLRRGGTLHLVANRHLPYEAVLRASFRTVREGAERDGFKLFEAVK